MKNKISLSLILCFWVNFIQLSAQSVSASFSSINSPYLSDYGKAVSLENKNSVIQNVKIEWQIKSDQYTITSNVNRSSYIVLPPNGRVVMGIDAFVNTSNISAPNLPEKVLRALKLDKILPEGEYEFCIKSVYPFDIANNTLNKNNDILIKMPVPCKTIVIRYSTPPDLIAPHEQDTFRNDFFQDSIKNSIKTKQFNFSWTPPTGQMFGSNLVYDLYILKERKGVNMALAMNQAINSRRNIDVLRRDLRTTFYTYSLKDPPLENGVYYWAVQVRDRSNRIQFINKGKSEIGKFAVQSSNKNLSELRIESNKQNDTIAEKDGNLYKVYDVFIKFKDIADSAKRVELRKKYNVISAERYDSLMGQNFEYWKVGRTKKLGRKMRGIDVKEKIEKSDDRRYIDFMGFNYLLSNSTNNVSGYIVNQDYIPVLFIDDFSTPYSHGNDVLGVFKRCFKNESLTVIPTQAKGNAINIVLTILNNHLYGNKKVRLVNMSFILIFDTDSMKNELKKRLLDGGKEGIMFICAAGNVWKDPEDKKGHPENIAKDIRKVEVYPASFGNDNNKLDNVISVGAFMEMKNGELKLSNNSNIGAKIAANGRYGGLEGYTSYAAPLITAEIVKYISLPVNQNNPNLTVQDVINDLKQKAKGGDDKVIWGYLPLIQKW